MSTNPFVTWCSKYETGVDIVDEQHKSLVRLINEFHDGLKNRQDDRTEVFEHAAHQAVAYVRNHFATEEQWMRETGFPGYERQRLKHAEFAQKLLDCVKRFDRKNPRSAFEFINYLADWLMSHIAIEDSNLRFHLKTLQERQSATTCDKA